MLFYMALLSLPKDYLPQFVRSHIYKLCFALFGTLKIMITLGSSTMNVNGKDDRCNPSTEIARVARKRFSRKNYTYNVYVAPLFRNSFDGKNFTYACTERDAIPEQNMTTHAWRLPNVHSTQFPPETSVATVTFVPCFIPSSTSRHCARASPIIFPPGFSTWSVG